MNINDLFDSLWGKDGKHPFGNPFDFEKFFISGKDLEEEIFEFTRGNYKTFIKCKFDKEGLLVGHAAVSYKVSNIEELRKELKEAIDTEDYTRAAALQKKIDDLDTNKGEEGNSVR